MTEQKLDRIMRRVLIDSLKMEDERVEKDQSPFFEPTSRYKRQMCAMVTDPNRWLHRRECPQWQRVAHRAAIILLVCILAFGWIMAINPTARATVVRWVVEWYENTINYSYSGEQDTDVLPDYEIVELPDGYVEKKRNIAPVLAAVTYENLKGDAIYFDYVYMYQGAQTNFVLSEDNVFDTLVNGMEGKFLKSQTSEKMNRLTWIDTEANIQFTLSACMEYDALLRMAESVSLCKTLK